MVRSKQLGLSEDFPQLLEIEIEKILPNPTQPRTEHDAGLTDKSIKELAASIDENQLLNPITVIRNPDDSETYILGTGQRRLKAFQYLKRETIPAIVARKGTPRELALIENMQRQDLHPLDNAEAIGGMKREFDWTDEEIAKALSTARSTVTEWILLLDLPEDIKRECRALDITKGLLVEVARRGDSHDDQRKLWDEIKAGKISTREAKRRRRQPGASSSAPVEDDRAADVPRDLKPVVRVISVGQEMRERLQKVLDEIEDKNSPKRIALAAHPDKLAELRELHKQIGTMISKISRQSHRQEHSKGAETEEESTEAA